MVELLSSGPQRAGQLAEALGASPSHLSRHLRVLRDSGLVTETVDEDDARVRIYALKRAGIEGVSTWVEEIETFWSSQLSSFKTYAERTRAKESKAQSHGGESIRKQRPQ